MRKIKLLILLVATGISQAATFDNDTFVGAANTLVTAHTGPSPQNNTWSLDSAFSDTAAKINPSGELISNSANASVDSLVYANGTPASANYSVSATFLRYDSNGSYMGIAARCSGAGKAYILIYFAGSGTWQFWNFQGAGVGVPLATGVTSALPIGTATSVRFAISGSSPVSLSAYLNGSSTAFISATDDGSHGQPIISAAGKAGLDFHMGAVATATTQIHVTAFSASDPFIAPTAGAATVTAAGTTTASVTAPAATGGSGAYTYQWYRSTTPGFTPGGGNLVSGATSLTLNDTGLTPKTNYFYVLVATDTSSGLTGSTNQIYVNTDGLAPIVMGFIGDSITQGVGSSSQPPAASQEVQALQNSAPQMRTVGISNQGVSGTTTADWVSGSANLTAAIAAFGSAGVTHVSVMLGTNDSKTAVRTSQAGYQANLQSTINALVSAGFTRIVLNAPPYVCPATTWDTTSNTLLVQYQAALINLVAANPSTTYTGDSTAFNWFQANQSQLSDCVHPNDSGHIALGGLWAQAFRNAVLGLSTTVSSHP